MRSVVIVFFASVCVTCVRSQSESNDQCLPMGKESFKAIVNSRQNQTGHWISKVGFKNGKGGNRSTDNSETSRWSVEIDHNIERYGGLNSNLDIVMTFIAPPQRVDNSYELFPGVGYHKFHSKVETWPKAREICESEGAHLAIINSEKEAEVLKKIFTRFPKVIGATNHDWAFIGMYEKLNHPGQHYTVFEEHLNKTGFTRWYPGQPSNVGNGTYGIINRHSGGFGDTLQTSHYGYFCEQELW